MPVDGRTPDPQVAALLRLDDLSHTSDLRGPSIPAARRRVAAGIAACDAPRPPDVDVAPASLPGPAGPMAARVYRPRGAARGGPALLWIHGGGWVTGVSRHARRALPPPRQARGNHGRFPGLPPGAGAPFPAGAEDAVAGFRGVVAQADALGVDARRIAVAGDSAGGNLTAVVARTCARDAIPPALQVPIHPALDATCSEPSHATLAEGWFLTRPMIDWYYGHYLGGRSDEARAKDPRRLPLLAPDLRGLPSAIVVTAGFDPLRDEGARYVERLREAGVAAELREERGLCHGFALLEGVVDASRSAMVEIAGPSPRGSAEGRGAERAPAPR